MEWFRVYHDVLSDPKVQLMSLDLRWRWFECLCMASMNSERGCLPSLEYVAFYFKMNQKESEVVLERLVDACLLYRSKGSKTLRVHNWEKRQRDSDDSASRKRAQRSRDRSGTVPSPHVRGRADLNSIPDTDTETDTETDNISLPSSEKQADENGKLETPTFENEHPEFPESNGMFVIMPGGHPMADGDAREVWGDIWRAWKNPKLCFAFYEHQQWVSKDGWMYAIRTCLKANGRPGSIRYLETIGVDFDINGPKLDKPVQRGAIGSVPYKPQGPIATEYVPMTAEQKAENKRLHAEYQKRMAAKNGKA